MPQTENTPLTASLFRNAIDSIRKLPRNCWKAALEAAESDLSFGQRAVDRISSQPAMPARKGRPPKAATASANRAPRKARTSAAAATTNGTGGNAGSTLTEFQQRVYNAVTVDGMTNAKLAEATGIAPNIIGRALSELTKRGMIAAGSGGSYSRTNAATEQRAA